MTNSDSLSFFELAQFALTMKQEHLCDTKNTIVLHDIECGGRCSVVACALLMTMGHSLDQSLEMITARITVPSGCIVNVVEHKYLFRYAMYWERVNEGQGIRVCHWKVYPFHVVL